MGQSRIRTLVTVAQERQLYGTRNQPGTLTEWVTRKEAELTKGLPRYSNDGTRPAVAFLPLTETLG